MCDYRKETVTGYTLQLVVSLHLCFHLYHPLYHSLHGVVVLQPMAPRSRVVLTVFFVSKIKHATYYSTNLPLARIAGYKYSGDSC